VEDFPQTSLDPSLIVTDGLIELPNLRHVFRDTYGYLWIPTFSLASGTDQNGIRGKQLRGFLACCNRGSNKASAVFSSPVLSVFVWEESTSERPFAITNSVWAPSISAKKKKHHQHKRSWMIWKPKNLTV